MNRSFSTNVVRPNLPLRKPSSIPAGVCGTLPSPRHLTMPSAPAVRLPSGAIGDGKKTKTKTLQNVQLCCYSPIKLKMKESDNSVKIICSFFFSSFHFAGPINSSVNRDKSGVCIVDGFVVCQICVGLIRNKYIKESAQIEHFGDKVREPWLRWHGQRRDSGYIGLRIILEV